jgi:hypothetical protein
MIEDEPLSQFHLRLAAPEGDAAELDDLTRNLRREMEESDVERVDLVPGGDLPEGAKGGLVTATGELNVLLKPGGPPNFLGMVRDWLSRQNQRVEIVATVGSSTFHISASITDVSAIVQALGNLTPDRGETTTLDLSGGADLTADQINVGGDVTGRDKIIQIKAEAGATVYIGQGGAMVQRNDSTHDQQPSSPAT